ncbi:uncharacterized protein isoform X2 [Rhodnius prolixus]
MGGSYMDSEEKQKRKDDGASRAYRRMGRTEYERYAKDMAQIWWDIPPTVEKSGLFMETSKLRIRGQPRYEWHNRILMDSCPQPDYTLKILKTAYKIYRLRLEKRYLEDNDTKGKSIHFWSEKKREEEPKWAHILDRPIFEQYVLMLKYIRTLGFKLAWKMGHKEIISSETPLRVLEKLHPLKRLDFRGAKHFLPEPFVTASDSETQLKINTELNRLDRAVIKSMEQKQRDFTTIRPEMVPGEEVSSSSSSSGDSSSSSTSISSEDEISKRSNSMSTKSSKLSKKRLLYGLSERAFKLLERKGINYNTYKDPGSEESFFADFDDLRDYFEDYLRNKEKTRSMLEREEAEYDDKKKDNNKDEDNKDDHEDDNDNDGKKDEQGRKARPSYSDQQPLPDNGPTQDDKRPDHAANSTKGRNVKDNYGGNSQPSTSKDNEQKPERKVNWNNKSSSKPGPSKKHDHVENIDEDGEYEVVEDINNVYPRVPICTPIGETVCDSGVCLINANCHGDYLQNSIRRKKVIYSRSVISSNEITDEETLTAAETRLISSRLLENATGDAGISLATANRLITDHFRQTATVLQNLIRNMTSFVQTTNHLLDRIESSIIRIEAQSHLYNLPSTTWNDIRRHIRIVINRIPSVSI